VQHGVLTGERLDEIANAPHAYGHKTILALVAALREARAEVERLKAENERLYRALALTTAAIPDDEDGDE
jgi:precorrin-6B methylase 1